MNGYLLRGLVKPVRNLSSQPVLKLKHGESQKVAWGMVFDHKGFLYINYTMNFMKSWKRTLVFDERFMELTPWIFVSGGFVLLFVSVKGSCSLYHKELDVKKDGLWWGFMQIVLRKTVKMRVVFDEGLCRLYWEKLLKWGWSLMRVYADCTEKSC